MFEGPDETIGKSVTKPADVTPGSAAMLSTISRCVRVHDADCAKSSTGPVRIHVAAVWIVAGSEKPGSIERRVANVRIISAALTTNASASATCTTTRALRIA